MKKHLIYTAMLLAIAFMLIPEEIYAVNTKVKFGGDALYEHADSLSDYVFGPVGRIAAIFGGASGVAYGLIQHSPAKILTFAAIMLGSAILPTFINGFYSMLLP